MVDLGNMVEVCVEWREFVAKAAFLGCHNEFVGGVYLEIILFVCMQSNEGLSELTLEQEYGIQLSQDRATASP